MTPFKKVLKCVTLVYIANTKITFCKTEEGKVLLDFSIWPQKYVKIGVFEIKSLKILTYLLNCLIVPKS